MNWLERTTQLRQWTRNGTRAPHKPLLLLYALGRFQEDADSELRYSAVEEDLRRLLTEYGPPNRTSPSYPFHHLVSEARAMIETSPCNGRRVYPHNSTQPPARARAPAGCSARAR